jgi:hypothetical protein
MEANFNSVSLEDIPNNILDQLYDIHFHTYQRKNTGVSKDCWLSNLNCDYHSLSKKQLFTYNYLGKNSIIDGYIIVAGAQIINNKYWVKILEGAAHPRGSYINSVSAFTEMFNHFLYYAKERKWNLWGEISDYHYSIFNLMAGFGFSSIENYELANSLYPSFLGTDAQYQILIQDDNLKIRRPTRLSPNYSGYLINFDQSRNCNRINQYLEHEYNR